MVDVVFVDEVCKGIIIILGKSGFFVGGMDLNIIVKMKEMVGGLFE